MFGADAFTVMVERRGKTWVTEYCSAVCGIKEILKIRIGTDFIAVSLGPIGAYDFAIVQKALKGNK